MTHLISMSQTMSQPTYNLSFIPNGEAGVRATLAAMSQIIKKYKKAPAIRELALKIVSQVPEKQWRKEVDAIFKWVQKNIRYVKDVRGVETLHTPIQLLRLRQGDCDDMSIMAASLLESLGHPTRLCAVGVNGGEFSHVFSQTKIGGNWVTLECTVKDFPLGKTPQKITKLITRHN